MDHELWLSRRLLAHGVAAVMPTVATPESRRDRMRRAIRDAGLEQVIAGRRAGKPKTYAEVFELLYGEPLIPNAKRTGART